jgi:tRNA (adenine57-N1/adenine58-N1)-methyltransferase
MKNLFYERFGENNIDENKQKKNKIEEIKILKKMDSFKGGNNTNIIKNGDLVMAILHQDDIRHFFIEKDKKFQCKFGIYSHSNIIGKEFGSKIIDDKNNGYIYILKPNPTLWSKIKLK